MRTRSQLFIAVSILVGACGGDSTRDLVFDDPAPGPTTSTEGGAPPDGGGVFVSPATEGLIVEPSNAILFIDTATTPATKAKQTYKVIRRSKEGDKDVTATAVFTLEKPELGQFTGPTFESVASLPPNPPGVTSAVTVKADGGSTGAQITVVPILRAGLGMLDGVLDLIPNAKVSVVGALTKAQAEELASTVMKFLPQASSTQGTACPTLPVVDEVKPLAQAVDKRIPFNAAQAQVFIGQPGYKRDDPDFFALLVGNHILGGGAFTSRLTNEVREKRGLTYSVYSYFAPGSHAGAFTIGLQTRPDQATQAVQVSKDVLKDFVANGPTEAELKAAKDNLIGGFALRIDSNEKLLGNVANIAWNNLPLNYLDVWTQQIDKITAAQILSLIHISEPTRPY